MNFDDLADPLNDNSKRSTLHFVVIIVYSQHSAVSPLQVELEAYEFVTKWMLPQQGT